MKQRIKAMIKNNPKILSFLLNCYKVISTRKFKTDLNNISELGSIYLKRSSLKITGKNNKVIIKDFARLIDCNITIDGNDNVVVVGENVALNKTNIYIQGNKNEFSMGKNTTTNSNVYIGVKDGTKLIIGEDCMFSKNIHIRTSDYHAIYNTKNERINMPESIIIGDHVWIGAEANILKGAMISNNSVLGSMSLLTKKFTQENVVIAGVPAKIINEGIHWTRDNVINNQ